MNHREWLEQRAPFVGASTAAALFDEHPFITLAQMARERREGLRQPDNPAMQRGRFLEAAVAHWWAAVHDLEVVDASDLYVVNDCLVATLDRLIVGEPAALEVKTTARAVHDVERYWWWQCQAQLACTGFERVEVAALDGTLSLQSFTVLPDLEAMRRVVREAARFLERLAAGEVFPLKHPPVDAVELDAEARALVRAWRFAQRNADLIGTDIARLKGMVDRHLGAHDAGTVNGLEVVRRFRRVTRNALDTKRLREEQPEVFAEYVKEPTVSTYMGLR